MSLVHEWGEAFATLVRLTVAHAERDGVRDPGFLDAPCWNTCRRLALAGQPVTGDDALWKAAFFEWVAYAAEQLYGDEAEDFAIQCRAIADVAILEAA